MKKLKVRDWIVFENDDYLVINKPPGVSSLHERIGIAESMIEAVRRLNENYQLCHRLDRDTSGVLLISKHSDAYRNAAIQFEKRKIEKVYHAVCDGVHHFEDQLVDLPLNTTRSGRSSINHTRGKKSLTVFNTLKNYQHFTLVECKPETGRLHQIRIHLASQHAPITADTIYGGQLPYLSRLKRNFTPSKQQEETPMIHRFALHAAALTFTGMDGTPITVEAPYPKDMAVLIKLLDKYDSYA